MTAVRPTAAERAALAYLLAALGRDGEFTGGNFVAYYEARSGRTSQCSRRHGWRRTGGRVLARMERRGLVLRTRSRSHSPTFRFTGAGLKAAEAWSA